MAFFEWLRLLMDGAWLLLSHVAPRSSFPKPLSRELETDAVRRLVAGDDDARRELIEHNLRLVSHIARKYARSGLEQDDLVSIGSIGLIKAVSSYKPESGRLAPYASRCVENEILMALRASKKLRVNVSLNEPMGRDRDGNDLLLSDTLGTEPSAVHDEAETRIEAGRAMALLSRVLDTRERSVIELRYGLINGEPLPQHEVARRLGISRSYVSRIEKAALEKLRAHL